MSSHLLSVSLRCAYAQEAVDVEDATVGLASVELQLNATELLAAELLTDAELPTAELSSNEDTFRLAVLDNSADGEECCMGTDTDALLCGSMGWAVRFRQLSSVCCWVSIQER